MNLCCLENIQIIYFTFLHFLKSHISLKTAPQISQEEIFKRFELLILKKIPRRDLIKSLLCLKRFSEDLGDQFFKMSTQCQQKEYELKLKSKSLSLITFKCSVTQTVNCKVVEIPSLDIVRKTRNRYKVQKTKHLYVRF